VKVTIVSTPRTPQLTLHSVPRDRAAMSTDGTVWTRVSGFSTRWIIIRFDGTILVVDDPTDRDIKLVGLELKVTV